MGASTHAFGPGAGWVRRSARPRLLAHAARSRVPRRSRHPPHWDKVSPSGVARGRGGRGERGGGHGALHLPAPAAAAARRRTPRCTHRPASSAPGSALTHHCSTRRRSASGSDCATIVPAVMRRQRSGCCPARASRRPWGCRARGRQARLCRLWRLCRETWARRRRSSGRRRSTWPQPRNGSGSQSRPLSGSLSLRARMDLQV